MKRRPLPRVSAAFAWSACIAIALSAQAQPAGQPSPDDKPRDDLSHGRLLLNDVRDNVYSFDDPAFYWFCRYVRAHPPPIAEPAAHPVPWKMLLERPSDYRGRLVLLEGILQARYAFDLANRKGIDRLYQCELSGADTRAVCTIICLTDPTDALMHSPIRAYGYFIKVRAFRTHSGEEGAGPLLVADHVEAVHSAELPRKAQAPDAAGTKMLVACTAGLAVAWYAIRRVTGRRDSLRARTSNRFGKSNPSPRDFDWLTRQQDSGTRGKV